MPEAAKLLLVSSGASALEAVRQAAPQASLRRAADTESARRLYAEDAPDVLLLDPPAAAQWLPELAEDSDAPPAIVLGAGPSPHAFACLPDAAGLAPWLDAALRFRALQSENMLIRRESERIHSGLLTSYGEAEEKYRALINDASEAIFLVDLASRAILEANRKAEELSGLPKAQLTRRSLTDVIESEGEPSLDQNWKRAQETGSLLHANAAIRPAGGGRISVEVSGSRISYAGHDVMQCICHDVTDRQRLEAQLRHQAEELERQVEERTRDLQRSNQTLVQQEKMAALGALVAGIAHDMHTPIGTITSNSDILARALVRLKDLIGGECCPESFRNNPDLMRVVNVVTDISKVNQLASDRIIAIVRSLRNFARLDEADVRSADLHEGLDSTLTLVHHELKNRITVKKEYGDIPHVPCHLNQLNQVFMNMLVNAAHAIQGQGALTIRTFREGDAVKIQIGDTGAGITPENLSRIFDTGFTTKGAGVGTGLGLAISQKIIQDHKGHIEVESEVGKGTTFTITLPVEWKTSS